MTMKTSCIQLYMTKPTLSNKFSNKFPKIISYHSIGHTPIIHAVCKEFMPYVRNTTINQLRKINYRYNNNRINYFSDVGSLNSQELTSYIMCFLIEIQKSLVSENVMLINTSTFLFSHLIPQSVYNYTTQSDSARSK